MKLLVVLLVAGPSSSDRHFTVETGLTELRVAAEGASFSLPVPRLHRDPHSRDCGGKCCLDSWSSETCVRHPVGRLRDK